MLELLRDSVWQFIGALLALVAIVVSLVAFYKQSHRKRLSYEVLADIPVLTIKEENALGLQISFLGEAVEKPGLFFLRIHNSGNTPITSTDYEHPIQVAFGDGAKILAAEIVDSSPKKLPIEVSISNYTASFSQSLLNPGDSFTCRILGSNLPGEYEVLGRIAGVSRIERLVDKPAYFGLLTFVGLALMLVAFFFSPSPRSQMPWEIRLEEVPFLMAILIGGGLILLQRFLDADLPPLNSANLNLVKSVFEKENGLEEAVYRRTNHWVSEAG